jgi:hypothetical protein
MPDLGFYLGLISSWHSDKPRFMNTVAALVQPLIDAQLMLEKLTADFDLDTAIGVQLDVLGQWIGRTRYVRTPISGVFFSFDDSIDGTPGTSPRTGFDQGVWLGRYQPTDAISALDDETYRTLLKMQALANQWDGTLVSIKEAFNAVFPGVIVQDLGDNLSTPMAMDVLIPGVHLSSLLLSVLEQDFPIKPAGVRLSIVETTVASQPIFGFDIDGDTFGGFDHGAWGKIIYSA